MKKSKVFGLYLLIGVSICLGLLSVHLSSMFVYMSIMPLFCFMLYSNTLNDKNEDEIK